MQVSRVFRVSFFVLMGMILLGVRAWSDPTMVPLALEFGCIFVAAGLIDLIWYWSGGHPIETSIEGLKKNLGRLEDNIEQLSQANVLVASAQEVGLVRVVDRQANFGTRADWLELIRQADDRVWLMGRTLHQWRMGDSELEELIRNKAQAGVDFRWLVMDEKNPHLDELKEQGAPLRSQITAKAADTLCYIEGIRGNLPEELREKVQIRTFTEHPLNQAVVIIDDRCIVTQYMMSLESANCPILIVDGPEALWFRHFCNEFWHVWQTAGRETLQKA